MQLSPQQAVNTSFDEQPKDQLFWRITVLGYSGSSFRKFIHRPAVHLRITPDITTSAGSKYNVPDRTSAITGARILNRRVTRNYKVLKFATIIEHVHDLRVKVICYAAITCDIAIEWLTEQLDSATGAKNLSSPKGILVDNAHLEANIVFNKNMPWNKF